MARAYGAIEAGGTKFNCLVGTGPDDVRAETVFPTGEPGPTLDQAIRFFRDQQPVAALGIACFGPVELRTGHEQWGHITSTPKPGWSGIDVAGPLAAALDVPAAFDTDVNGAALGEGRWGAAARQGSFVYVTVGTGIGAGALVAGRLVHGLVHPEVGHLSVPRQAGDDFAGRCPYHGDCLEGMASGPALEDRFGIPARDLAGADLARAVELEAGYLAAGLRNVVYALAPERIVVGGGVAKLPGLLPAVGERLRADLAGYPGLPEHARDDFVVPAALGDRAGALGALVLAEGAVVR